MHKSMIRALTVSTETKTLYLYFLTFPTATIKKILTTFGLFIHQITRQRMMTIHSNYYYLSLVQTRVCCEFIRKKKKHFKWSFKFSCNATDS